MRGALMRSMKQMQSSWFRGLTRAVVGTALLVPAGAIAQRPEVALISRAADGGQTNGRSELPTVNAEGSIIGFKSAASNLIASDGNGSIDVFLYERDSGTIVRIPGRTSFPPSDPDGESFPPGLDYSGNTVAFGSAARNLVRNDLNQQPDAFVYDRAAARTHILTLVLDEVGEGSLGGRVPDLPVSVNADGNFIVFTSGSDFLVNNDRNEVFDVFLYNRISDEIDLISVANLGGGGERAGNDLSANGAVSGDGNFVVFCSEASNLTSGSPENLAGIFLRNRTDRTTRQIATLSQQRCLRREYSPAISENGAYVAFVSDQQLDVGDDNGVADIFVWNDGTIVRVSEGLGGAAGNGPSVFPSISANGGFIAFQSSASNLIDGDDNQNADVFVTDVVDRRLARASETAGGADFPAASGAPRVSADGVTVVFQSDAPLSPEDQNAFTDIYSVVNILSFTPTPTPTVPTATPTMDDPGRTPTATRTPTVGGSTTPTSETTTPGTTTPQPTTPGGGGTPTATRSGGGGGGGGGCSCRIDPESGLPADGAPWQALLLPAVLLVWRRQRSVPS